MRVMLSYPFLSGSHGSRATARWLAPIRQSRGALHPWPLLTDGTSPVQAFCVIFDHLHAAAACALPALSRILFLERMLMKAEERRMGDAKRDESELTSIQRSSVLVSCRRAFSRGCTGRSAYTAAPSCIRRRCRPRAATVRSGSKSPPRSA